MLGLVIFGVASTAAAFASTAAGLAIARGAMGVGGACTMPSTLSVLGSVLVETGSYAWPLPVVAVVAVVTGLGIAWAFRPSRATRRSNAAPIP